MSSGALPGGRGARRTLTGGLGGTVGEHAALHTRANTSFLGLGTCSGREGEAEVRGDAGRCPEMPGELGQG